MDRASLALQKEIAVLRSTCLGFALACLLAVPALAEDHHDAGLGFSRPDLVKSHLKAGQLAVEIYADPRVDVGSLVADIDLSRAASVQSISDRVNEKRKALYPDEEIILSLTPPAHSNFTVLGEKASLVKALFWFNNNNCATCYWYAQYTSTVATMFIDNVRSGSYDLFDRVGSANFVFRFHLPPGGVATRYSFGAKTLRGFKGAATGVPATADVVMYFFN
jgi:hypothetical protein